MPPYSATAPRVVNPTPIGSDIPRPATVAPINVTNTLPNSKAKYQPVPLGH